MKNKKGNVTHIMDYYPRNEYIGGADPQLNTRNQPKQKSIKNWTQVCNILSSGLYRKNLQYPIVGNNNNIIELEKL